MNNSLDTIKADTKLSVTLKKLIWSTSLMLEKIDPEKISKRKLDSVLEGCFSLINGDIDGARRLIENLGKFDKDKLDFVFNLIKKNRHSLKTNILSQYNDEKVNINPDDIDPMVLFDKFDVDKTKTLE